MDRKRKMIYVQYVKSSDLVEYITIDEDNENDLKKTYEIKKLDFDKVVSEQRDFDCIAYSQMSKIIADLEDDTDLKDYFLVIEFDSLDIETKNIFINGLKVIIDAESIHYKRFGRSASMARQGKVVFVNSEYIDELTKRCTLGIENTEENNCFPWLDTALNHEGLALSKYEAYKGLSFSGGFSLEYLLGLNKDESNDIKIDESNVIVIDDYCVSSNKQQRNQENKIVNETSFWVAPENNGDIVIEQDLIKLEKEINVNVFDGEGLISKELAQEISKLICDNPDTYYSFQIRMPFVKGVLHSVDYKKFFKDNGITQIKDILGDIYDISGIDIILTKSMFKAYGWYKLYRGWYKKKNSFTSSSSCFLDVYFTEFKEKKHSLFICNTNRNHSKVDNKLNYQVLHTLNMPQSDFINLVDENIKIYNSLKDNKEKLVERFFAYKEPENYRNKEYSNEVNNSEINAAENKENSDFISGYEAFKRVVSDNYAFLDTNFGIKRKKEVLDGFKQSIMNANLITGGTTCILSADLLLFLQHLVYLSNSEDEKKREICNRIKKEILRFNQFYSPALKISKDKVKLEYAIFRNPHMSLSEHVFMNVYVPKKESLRKEYLGHLKRVIMINPVLSMAHFRMGGADFDGDIVNIVDDDKYLKALKNAVVAEYNYFNEDSKIKLENLDRNLLPIPYIPNSSVETIGVEVLKDFEKYSEEQLLLFKRAKKSNVAIGNLSNMAFSKAAIAYGDTNESNPEIIEFERCTALNERDTNEGNSEIIESKMQMAKFTILAGMTLDSVKTGKSIKFPENMKVHSWEYEPFIQFQKSDTGLESVELYKKMIDDIKEESAKVKNVDFDKVIVEKFKEEKIIACNLNILPIYVYFKVKEAHTIPIKTKKLSELTSSSTNLEIDKEILKECIIELKELSEKYKKDFKKLFVKEIGNENIRQKIFKIMDLRHDKESSNGVYKKIREFLEQQFIRSENDKKFYSKECVKTIKEKINELRYELLSEEKRKEEIGKIFENIDDDVFEEIVSLKLNKSNLLYLLLRYAPVVFFETIKSDIDDSEFVNKTELAKKYREKAIELFVAKKFVTSNYEAIEFIFYILLNLDSLVNQFELSDIITKTELDNLSNNFIWTICGKEIVESCDAINRRRKNKNGK